MNKLISSIALAALIVGVNLTTQAQSKFEKATADAEKLEKKSFFDFPRERGKNGKGYTVYYPKLKTPPKKVALVSFAFHDPGFTKSTSNTQTRTISTVRTPTTTAQSMVDMYCGVAIDPLKKTFAEYGMELLTPDEFLDTDEKKTFYTNFVLEKRNKGMKGLNNLATAGTKVDISLGAKGYRAFIPKEEMVFGTDNSGRPRYNMLECKDPKMMEGLGDKLANALGVDAVVIVYTTAWTKDQLSVNVEYVTMAMFGPNPISLPPDKKDGALYRTGLYYGVARVKVGEKSTDKKATGSPGNGYGNIMVGLSHKLGKWLKEKTAEEDKS